MKQNQIMTMQEFNQLRLQMDRMAQIDQYNNEVWSARDLAPLFGYNISDKGGSVWQNFSNAIGKAILSCQTGPEPYRSEVCYHFRYIPDVSQIPGLKEYVKSLVKENYNCPFNPSNPPVEYIDEWGNTICEFPINDNNSRGGARVVNPTIPPTHGRDANPNNTYPSVCVVNPTIELRYLYEIFANRFCIVGGNAIRINHHDDFILSRHAAMLIVQNCDPTKPEIAFYQAYFACLANNVQDMWNRYEYNARQNARQIYTDADKVLSSAITNAPGYKKGDIPKTKDAGNMVFYGMPTAQYKEQHGIPLKKPIADFEQPFLSTMRAGAMYGTALNADIRNLNMQDLDYDYARSNNILRQAVQEIVGMAPEEIETLQDYKKLERKVNKSIQISSNDPTSMLSIKAICPFLDPNDYQ